MTLLEYDDDVEPWWYLYGALGQLVMCKRGEDSWQLASEDARSWLSGCCCERVEFVTVSVEIQSEEFCSLDVSQGKST